MADYSIKIPTVYSVHDFLANESIQFPTQVFFSGIHSSQLLTRVKRLLGKSIRINWWLKRKTMQFESTHKSVLSRAQACSAHGSLGLDKPVKTSFLRPKTFKQKTVKQITRVCRQSSIAKDVTSPKCESKLIITMLPLPRIASGWCVSGWSGRSHSHQVDVFILYSFIKARKSYTAFREDFQ